MFLENISWKYKIILSIFFLLLFYYLFLKIKTAIHIVYNQNNNLEHFQDKLDYSIEYVLNDYNEKDDDIFDKEYVDLYSIAYHDLHDVSRDAKVIQKYIPKDWDKEKVSILVGGCGVGKVPNYWKNDLQYKNVVGIDFSKNMLQKAENLYPSIQYIRGNLVDSKVFTANSTHLFIMDERTLFMNHIDDMKKIIQNVANTLMDDGLFVLPVFDRNNLQLASRYYSSNYIDHLGIVHGFTYLDHFSHDCWYIPDIDKEEERMEELMLYFDKFVMKENGKKRIKSTMYYFPTKTTIYDLVLSNGFEKLYIEPIGTQIVGGYELAIFKKKKSSMSVSEIQNKN